MKELFRKIQPHSGKIFALCVILFFSFLAYNLYHAPVTGLDEKFVYLVNGTTRTLDMPKKKNAKHIQIIKNLPIEVTEILEENLSDLTVKRAIKQYCQMNEGRQES